MAWHLPMLLVGKIALGVYVGAWAARNVSKLRGLVVALERSDYVTAKSHALSILSSAFSILFLGDFGHRLQSFIDGDHSGSNIQALSSEANRLIDGVR